MQPVRYRRLRPDCEELPVGEDPRAIQRLYWDMLRMSRQNLGGIVAQAIEAMGGIKVPWRAGYTSCLGGSR